MAPIRLSFSTAEPAEAAQLAQELRAELLRDGVSDRAISIERADPRNMDLGSLVELSLHYGSIVVEMAAIAHTLYELCFRNHSGLTLSTPRGEFHFSAGKVDLDDLRVILDEAAAAEKNE